MSEQVVRVVLVEDHHVARAGIRSILETAGMEVIGEADGAKTAMRTVARDEPDVVILDVRLPDGSGVDVCRALRKRFPSVKVLVFTSYADPGVLADVMEAGASGFCLKRIDAAQLVESVRRVAEGGQVLEPEAHLSVQGSTERLEEDPILSTLSANQRRIVQLVADGLTNRQIAERMFISEKTIKNHVSETLHKLGMHRRSEMAAWLNRHQAHPGYRYHAESWDE